jgi:outer membrane PBP1 activator LpoA protein
LSVNNPESLMREACRRMGAQGRPLTSGLGPRHDRGERGTLAAGARWAPAAKTCVRMESFKSPVSRLARLFKKSRDVWKTKALDKQQRLRAAQVRIRDLEKSRAYWKQRALATEGGRAVCPGGQWR